MMLNNSKSEGAALNAAPLPADINQAILQTIMSVTALCDILAKENEALEQCKSAAFFALQDEKVETGRRYEALVAHLMSKPLELKSADPKLKSQLQGLQDRFGDVTQKNLFLLERMNNATSKLKEHIVGAVRKAAEVEGQFSYGASGKMQKGVKSSIGINERA